MFLNELHNAFIIFGNIAQHFRTELIPCCGKMSKLFQNGCQSARLDFRSKHETAVNRNAIPFNDGHFPFQLVFVKSKNQLFGNAVAHRAGKPFFTGGKLWFKQ